MKILLAVDGSTCSDRAVDEVARRPWPAESEIKVVSITETPMAAAMEPYGFSQTYFLELEAVGRKRTQQAIDRALERLNEGQTKSLKISYEMIQGMPKKAILDAANDWGADLIVVGSHGYGVLDRFLIGSVSNAVAIHAKCSVEIVR